MAEVKVKVKVGDKVMVTSGYARSNHPTERTVTAVARVWITLDNRYRFRLDTQTDGSGYGSTPRFYTMDQWAARQREMEAQQFLREQGIDIRHSSKWTVLDLADLLRKELDRYGN